MPARIGSNSMDIAQPDQEIRSGPEGPPWVHVFGVREWAWAIVIFAVTFAVFFPATRGIFLSWDDAINLTDNQDFRGFTLAHLKWMWTNHLMDHYVPITWMSFGLDYVIWGPNAFGYHLTNVLIHAANALLFFVLALELFRLASSHPPQRASVALLSGGAVAALFFGLHPLRVESVAWATERRDVLSGFSYLLALIAYLRRFRNTNRPQAGGYWWSLVLFTLAVLSKELTLTLPLVLIVLDIYPLRRFSSSPRHWFQRDTLGVWIEKTPFFAISIASAASTLYLGMRHGVVDTLGSLGWMPRIAITLYGMAFYVWKTLLPAGLSPFYPVTPHKIALAGMPFLVSAAAVLLITGIAIALRRRAPALLAIWVFFSITLVPVGGILHNGFQIAADRYTYLACMGFALLAGAGFAWCWQAMERSNIKRGAIALAVVLVFVALAAQTRRQITYWLDSDKLWQRAIAVEPSTLAYTLLGAGYYREGDVLGAMENYRKAIALSPETGLAHLDLGIALMQLGRWPEAAGEFRIAVQLLPKMAEPHQGLGQALVMVGKPDEAIDQFHQALAIQPDNADTRTNLARALLLKDKMR